jgi:hypothetical protein
LPAFELNTRFDIPIIESKNKSVDYAENGVFLFCRLEFLLWQGVDILDDDDDDATKHFDWRGHEVRRCRIRQRNDDGTYLAEVINFTDDDETTREVFSGAAFQFPRQAFYFQDMPYQRSHHKAWSFRHDMRIGNDIFPEVWKDRIT